MMTTSLVNVAVSGSGTMGAGIAVVAAAAGHPVRILILTSVTVDLAIEGIAGRLVSRVARGKLALSRPTRCWRAPASGPRFSRTCRCRFSDRSGLWNGWKSNGAVRAAGGDLRAVNVADQ